MNVRFTVACLIAALLAGCASTEVKTAVKSEQRAVNGSIDGARQQFAADAVQPIILPSLRTPYFDGESVALAPKGGQLPPALQSRSLFHLKTTGMLSASMLARALSEETGLAVVSDPVVRTSADAKDKVATRLVDVAALPPMPLQQFLNVTSAALGVDWDWYDDALHLQSSLTRSYQISNTASISKGTMRLGKTAQAQAGATGGNSGSSGSFNSQLEGEISSDADPWAELETSIKGIAANGQVVRDRALGLFVVSCSKACHRQVKEFVDTANHIMTQQVLFHIVEMTVETSSKGQSGINWNVLYQQVAGKYGVSFSTPSSLVNSAAGAIAFNILNPAGATKGFNGSQAIFEALSAATHVIEAKPFDILAINNEPTTLSNINQQTFTASTTVVPTGISGTPVYTQNPGYATYGQLIQISPTILPQQKVMVRFGIDDTKLKQLIVSNQPGGMDKVLLGGLTYQTKAILNIGSTLILSGFKVKTSTLNEQGLLSEQRMGSEAGALDSTETIIMITPYLAGT